MREILETIFIIGLLVLGYTAFVYLVPFVRY